jgi:hypothetical protein
LKLKIRFGSGMVAYIYPSSRENLEFKVSLGYKTLSQETKNN